MHDKQSDVFELFSEIYKFGGPGRDEPPAISPGVPRGQVDVCLRARAHGGRRSANPSWSTPARTNGSAASFSNKTIKLYPSFADFYGMEDTIERIVGYFRYASQGLEERKQILYLARPRWRRQIFAGRAAEEA